MPSFNTCSHRSTLSASSAGRVTAIRYSTGKTLLGTALLAAALMVPGLAVAQIAPIPDQSAAETQSPGWLGVALSSEGVIGGIEIVRIFPTSPAEAAGIEVGNVVTHLNGVAVTTTTEFVATVGSMPASDTAALTLQGGTVVNVILGERPPRDTDWARMLVGTEMPDLPIVDPGTGVAIEAPVVDAELTLVEVWATWCGPCLIASQELARMRGQYDDTQLGIVAISEEEAQTVNGFLGGHDPAYTVGIVADDQASDALWVDSLPSYYLVDSDGEIVATGTGLDGLEVIRRDIAQRLSSN